MPMNELAEAQPPSSPEKKNKLKKLSFFSKTEMWHFQGKNE